MRTTFTAAGCAALVALLASSPLLAQQKTARDCRAEWSANREAIAASGKTQRVFIAECRGVPVPASARATAELGKGQYATEAEAKASCPGDTVVWANLRSKVYHDSSSRNYGATKIGAYMCAKESVAAGFHAPKAARDPGRDISKPASS